MPNSPFHGIFSALGDTLSGSDDATKASVPINDTEETTTTNPATSGAGQIAVDIYEQDNYYIIRAPIAGVKLSDLDIEVDGKVIRISGERSAEEISDDRFFIQECYWGKFSRSVTLPTNIDPKKVKATYSKDSILKVLVPKEEKVKIVRVSEG